MYGYAITCDICKHSEMVAPEHSLLMSDMTVPPGWVRIYANQPKQYRWAMDEEGSNIERAYDCCSLGCAGSALGEHHDNIRHREEEQVASA